MFSLTKDNLYRGQLSTPYMGLQNSEGLVSLDTRVGIPLGNQKNEQNCTHINCYQITYIFLKNELLFTDLQIKKS